MKNKYLFSSIYHKPICIALYDNDDIAVREAEKLSKEKGYPINVSRLLTQRAVDGAKREQNSEESAGSPRN